MSKINKQILADRIDTALNSYLYHNRQEYSNIQQTAFDDMVKKLNLEPDTRLTISDIENILPVMQKVQSQLIFKAVTHALSDALSDLLDDDCSL